MSRLHKLFYGFRTLFKFDNRWQLVINRLFFPKRGLTTYVINGMEVLIDHRCGEQTSTRTCLVDGLYDPYFRAMGKTDSLTVLDLGANGGGFPLGLQHFGQDVSKLVSVELNPQTHARLLHNLQRNFRGEFEAVRGAAGGEPSTITVQLGGGSVADSIVDGFSIKQRGGETETRTVRIWTIDEIIEKHFADSAPDLCKIDVEGAEYGIVNGSHASSLAGVRWLIVEVHEVAGEDEAQFHEALMAFGFERIPIDEPVREDNVYLYENRRGKRD